MFPDKLHIQWRKASKKLSLDASLPVIILPITLLIASISLRWTIFTFICLFLLLFCLQYILSTQTKFYVSWTVTSVVILYLIFELIVIPFLQILLEENVTLSLLIIGFILCLYKIRKRINYEIGGNEVENCDICHFFTSEKDHHSQLFDCCVTRYNRSVYLLAHVFAILALFYSSNLTLTSVCHPFIFYKTVLLPDDCSDVYQQFELSLSFVSAIYSICLAIILLISLLCQVLLISLGLSTEEWKKLPFYSKVSLTFLKNRPNNQGCLKNWSIIFCRSY